MRPSTRRRHHGAGRRVDSAGAAGPNEAAAMSARATSATVMPGCSASRSGSTFDAMPGMRRASSLRAATGKPITTSSAPVRRCRNIAVAAVMTRASVVRLRAANVRSAYFARTRQVSRCAQEAPGLARRPAAERQAAGLRPRRQSAPPIMPVLIELTGRAIRRVLIQQRRSEDQTRRLAMPVPAQRAV